MTASEQWQVIINAEPSPILWTWEHCASILCNRAEQLDRSHPKVFMDYMRDNPWYFREAFGIAWSEEAAREGFWKMDRRGR